MHTRVARSLLSSTRAVLGIQPTGVRLRFRRLTVVPGVAGRLNGPQGALLNRILPERRLDLLHTGLAAGSKDYLVDLLSTYSSVETGLHFSNGQSETLFQFPQP